MTTEPDNLDGFQRQAIDDYLALRGQQASPDVAAVLSLAAAVNRVASRLGPLQVAQDAYRDPSRIVSWLRQFNQIQKNLAEADDTVLKGTADQKFEEALREMRNQLPPLEG